MENKVQEYIEKRKNEEISKELQEKEQNEAIKQKREESKEKVKNVMGKAGDFVKTGATVVSAIPHAVTLAIGAGAGTLIPKILKEINKQKGKK